MTFEPGPALGLLVLGCLYVRAVRLLEARGYRVPAGQQAFWWTGFALTGKGANRKVWGGTSYDPD